MRTSSATIDRHQLNEWRRGGGVKHNDSQEGLGGADIGAVSHPSSRGKDWPISARYPPAPEEE